MSRIENPFVTCVKPVVPRAFVITLALSMVLLFVSPASAQDTRTVTEPTFPTTICQTLTANYQATNGVFSNFTETTTNSKPDHDRIQNAINACTTSSGQVAVELSANGSNNAFLTSPFTLANGVVLLIDPGVTLYASLNAADYGGGCPSSSCTNFITGQTAPLNNAGIMGYGAIDGRGGMTLLGNTKTIWDPSYEGSSRARLVNISKAVNFTLYKITLQNAWMMQFYLQNTGTNGVTAWGVKISAPYTSPNTDGFDPTGNNVTLTNSYISTGDDMVAIKGSTTVNGMTFSHNRFYSGHGMSIGSETNGGVSNVYVTDLTMHGDKYDTNNNGLRVKSYAGKGGTVQNVVYDGVCIKDTDHPLVFDAYYSSGSGTPVPFFKDITVRNTHVVDDPKFFYFSSTKNVDFWGYDSTNNPLNIRLDNVNYDQQWYDKNGVRPSTPTPIGYFNVLNTNFTLGPGPVNLQYDILSMNPGSGVTVTDQRTNSNPPYDCTNAWTYLATELFASPNTSGPVSITTSQTLPLMVVLQPIVVGGFAGSVGDPLPNGTVTIYDGGNPVTTVPLSTTSWLTQVPLSGLTVGTHTLTAHFSGDALVTKYAAMDFGSVTVNVTADTGLATTTTLTGASTVDGGATLQLTATVTAASGTPTGTVSFLDGSTELGTASLDGTGVAKLTVNSLNAGLHNLKANYLGSSGFAASASTQDLGVTVKGATTTTLSPSGTVLNQGSPLTLTATISSVYGTPVTGTVTFYDGATSLGTGDVDATSKATFTTSSLGVGSHTLTAAYGDTTFYYGSTSAGVAVTVKGLTTTALTVLPNPATAGTSVALTATVTSGSGTPTGTVSFDDGGTNLGTAALDGTGVATFSHTFGGSGTHNLTATYTGATGFATSGSSVVQLVVNASTTTSLTANPNPVNSGSPLTLTAAVAAGILTPPAGGTVTFYDGASSLGTGTTDGSGAATLTTSSLSGGAHSITATYAGATGYASSTSSPVSVTVNGGSGIVTTTVLNVSPAPPMAFGTAATFTATVTSSGPTPAGSVAFMDGLTQIGNVTLDGAGHASFITSALSAGTHSITANYSGGVGFSASASSALPVIVTDLPTTTVLVANPPTATFGSSVALTATVTASSGTPGGTVTFYDGATSLGTGPLNGSGVATLSTTTLAVGSHSLTAIYTATTNYRTSTSSTSNVTVNAVATTTTLVASPASVTVGGSVTLTATVTSGAGTPGGTVTFYDGATSIGTGPLNGSGVAALSTSSLTVGSHSLTAAYTATTNYGASTSPVASVTVSAAASTTTLVANPTTVTVGSSVTLTATVTSGAGTPSGTVTFYDGAASLGTGTLNGSGVATYSTTSLTVGSHTLTATYTATTNYSTSTSTAASVMVSAASTTTVLVANPTTVMFGASVTLTATVTSGSGTPAGTVTFYDGATSLGTGTLNGSGVATLSTTSLPVGTHNVTATYTATTNYGASTSSAATVTVSAAPTTTVLVANPATVTFGASVTLTATVTSGSGTPAGTVTFYDGATSIGTGTLNGSGVATYSTTSLAGGAHSLGATYGATTNYATSTSSAASVTVNAAATTTTLLASPTTVTFGGSVTLTATVTSGAGTPGGTVTFYDGANSLGTGTLNGSGVATYSTSSLTVGTHSLKATYMVTANYAASASSTASITVNPAPDFSVTATPSTVNVAIGSSGTTSITLTPQNGFSGSVALSCGSLPAYVTCTFAPASPITVSGSAVSVQLTVVVAATTTASLNPQQMPLRLAPLTLPALFAFVPLMMLPGRQKLSAKLLIGFILAAMLLASIGCGGGSKTPPAPVRPPIGAQTVTVTGVSGSTSHPLPLTINITN